MTYISRGKKLLLLAMIIAVLAPAEQVLAAEPMFPMMRMPAITTAVADENQMLSGTPLSVLCKDKTFAVVGEEGYATIYQEARADSDYVGKVFQDSLLKILERAGEWTKVSSGNVEGYIESQKLIPDEVAMMHAKIFMEREFPLINISALDSDTFLANFPVGETVEEEEARLAAEKRARIQAQGQAVVDYASRFLGNPYVYGGTSLTRGTDCSGFVLSVYANFGYSLPHSSYGMRSVGRSVSYSEIMPGDIICYPGHVGIYAGNGQIIHASGERTGIIYSNARYTRIVSIRRMF